MYFHVHSSPGHSPRSRTYAPDHGGQRTYNSRTKAVPHSRTAGGVRDARRCKRETASTEEEHPAQILRDAKVAQMRHVIALHGSRATNRRSACCSGTSHSSGGRSDNNDSKTNDDTTGTTNNIQHHRKQQRHETNRGEPQTSPPSQPEKRANGRTSRLR